MADENKTEPQNEANKAEPVRATSLTGNGGSDQVTVRANAPVLGLTVGDEMALNASDPEVIANLANGNLTRVEG